MSLWLSTSWHIKAFFAKKSCLYSETLFLQKKMALVEKKNSFLIKCVFSLDVGKGTNEGKSCVVFNVCSIMKPVQAKDLIS